MDDGSRVDLGLGVMDVQKNKPKANNRELKRLKADS